MAAGARQGLPVRGGEPCEAVVVNLSQVPDPNLFRLDWEQTFEVLAAIMLLAFVVERALSPLFENRWWLKRWDDKLSKELIAVVVAAGVCWAREFDAISIILRWPEATRVGETLTGAVIAGGSKASIKLFRDVLDFKSGAYREKEEAGKPNPPSAPTSPPTS